MELKNRAVNMSRRKLAALVPEIYHLAEMGDKTQLMLVAMTEKHKMADIILGTAIAILVLNGIAVLAGGAIGQFIPSWIIKFIAAAAFLFFAAIC